jgi:hypothetical protein
MENKSTRVDEIIGTLDELEAQLISQNKRLNALMGRIYGPKLEKGKEANQAVAANPQAFLENFKGRIERIFEILGNSQSALSELEEFI